MNVNQPQSPSRTFIIIIFIFIISSMNFLFLLHHPLLLLHSPKRNAILVSACDYYTRPTDYSISYNCDTVKPCDTLCTAFSDGYQNADNSFYWMAVTPDAASGDIDPLAPKLDIYGEAGSLGGTWLEWSLSSTTPDATCRKRQQYGSPFPAKMLTYNTTRLQTMLDNSWCFFVNAKFKYWSFGSNSANTLTDMGNGDVDQVPIQTTRYDWTGAPCTRYSWNCRASSLSGGCARSGPIDTPSQSSSPNCNTNPSTNSICQLRKNDVNYMRSCERWGGMLNWTRRIDNSPYEDLHVPSRMHHTKAKSWCDQFNGKMGATAAWGPYTPANGLWMYQQAQNNLNGRGYQYWAEAEDGMYAWTSWVGTSFESGPGWQEVYHDPPWNQGFLANAPWYQSIHNDVVNTNPGDQCYHWDSTRYCRTSYSSVSMRPAKDRYYLNHFCTRTLVTPSMRSRHTSYAFANNVNCFMLRNCVIQMYLASALTRHQSAQIDYAITLTGEATHNAFGTNVVSASNSFSIGDSSKDFVLKVDFPGTIVADAKITNIRGWGLNNASLTINVKPLYNLTVNGWTSFVSTAQAVWFAGETVSMTILDDSDGFGAGTVIPIASGTPCTNLPNPNCVQFSGSPNFASDGSGSRTVSWTVDPAMSATALASIRFQASDIKVYPTNSYDWYAVEIRTKGTITVTLSPSRITVGGSSTATIALTNANPVYHSVTVTPSSTCGGLSFSPTSVTFSSGNNPSDTITITSSSGRTTCSISWAHTYSGQWQDAIPETILGSESLSAPSSASKTTIPSNSLSHNQSTTESSSPSLSASKTTLSSSSSSSKSSSSSSSSSSNPSSSPSLASSATKSPSSLLPPSSKSRSSSKVHSSSSSSSRTPSSSWLSSSKTALPSSSSSTSPSLSSNSSASSSPTTAPTKSPSSSSSLSKSQMLSPSSSKSSSSSPAPTKAPSSSSSSSSSLSKSLLLSSSPASPLSSSTTKSTLLSKSTKSTSLSSRTPSSSSETPFSSSETPSSSSETPSSSSETPSSSSETPSSSSETPSLSSETPSSSSETPSSSSETPSSSSETPSSSSETPSSSSETPSSSSETPSSSSRTKSTSLSSETPSLSSETPSSSSETPSSSTTGPSSSSPLLSSSSSSLLKIQTSSSTKTSLSKTSSSSSSSLTESQSFMKTQSRSNFSRSTSSSSAEGDNNTNDHNMTTKMKNISLITKTHSISHQEENSTSPNLNVSSSPSYSSTSSSDATVPVLAAVGGLLAIVLFALGFIMFKDVEKHSKKNSKNKKDSSKLSSNVPTVVVLTNTAINSSTPPSSTATTTTSSPSLFSGGSSNSRPTQLLSPFVLDKPYQIDLAANNLTPPSDPDTHASGSLLTNVASSSPLFQYVENELWPRHYCSSNMNDNNDGDDDARSTTFSIAPTTPNCRFTLGSIDVVHSNPCGIEFRMNRLQQLRSQNGAFFNPSTDHFTAEQLQVLDALRDQFLPRPSYAHEKSPNLINVFHGTKIERVESVVHGLVAVRSTDAGFFGSGVYTTPSIEYAAKYARGDFDPANGPHSPRQSDGCFPVIWCVAAVGVCYPLTREVDYSKNNHVQVGGSGDDDGNTGEMQVSDFFGAPLKPGYDCHCVAVNQTSGFQAVPRKDMQYMEVVFDQESQVLPIAVLWVKPI